MVSVAERCQRRSGRFRVAVLVVVRDALADEVTVYPLDSVNVRDFDCRRVMVKVAVADDDSVASLVPLGSVKVPVLVNVREELRLFELVVDTVTCELTERDAGNERLRDGAIERVGWGSPLIVDDFVELPSAESL